MSSQKKVLITGVTRGIGLQIAKSFLEQGDIVFGVSRSLNPPEELQNNKSFTYQALDISAHKDVRQFFKNHGTSFDLIVNCAGILKLHGLQDTQPEDWNETMRVNTSGSFYIGKYGTEHFLKMNKQGMIIFIGSRWGVSGSLRDPSYAASKSALRALVKSLQEEGVKSGIRYILLSPGSVLTDMSRAVDHGVDGNILKTQDIAELVIYLSGTPARVIFDEISIKAFPYDLINS
jgi:NAD(P)-dependent dehydrogenase (short-subunit alcohol dehydrogenase family)